MYDRLNNSNNEKGIKHVKNDHTYENGMDRSKKRLSTK